MSDGKISNFPDSQLNEDLYVEHKISNSHIAQIEIIYSVAFSTLCGLKFFDIDGKVLISCGLIDNPYNRSHPGFRLKMLTLNKNERPIGIKSSGRSKNLAQLFSMQFIIF